MSRRAQQAGLTIDPTGVVFRPEGRFFITAISPKEGEPDPDAEDFDFDHEVFDREIWPQLAARVPAFETLRCRTRGAATTTSARSTTTRSWVRIPQAPGLVLACGFSGHGLQHSPGVGRGIAELIMHGGYRTIDLKRFGYERVRRGRADRRAERVLRTPRMARVLAISSQVARGHVGLAAIVPALQGLGHEVIALPTVLLSNHPGHGTVAGEQVAPALLRRMLDALDGERLARRDRCGDDGVFAECRTCAFRGGGDRAGEGAGEKACACWSIR